MDRLHATQVSPARPTEGAATRGRELLTAEEVADMLGMGVDWIWAQTRAGRIPSISLGRFRRYRREAIEEWLRDLEAAGSRRR
jgi:excisionase family DNA binding protein